MRILPKEVEVSNPLAELSDDEVVRAIELIGVALCGAADNEVARAYTE